MESCRSGKQCSYVDSVKEEREGKSLNLIIMKYIWSLQSMEAWSKQEVAVYRGALAPKMCTETYNDRHKQPDVGRGPFQEAELVNSSRNFRGNAAFQLYSEPGKSDFPVAFRGGIFHWETGSDYKRSYCLWDVFLASIWPVLASTTVSCGGNMLIWQDTRVEMRLKSVLHVLPAAVSWTN